MHLLYKGLIEDGDLSQERRNFLKTLGKTALAGGAASMLTSTATAETTPNAALSRNFETAERWLRGFFDLGAEEIVKLYADDFVWEDIELFKSITNKEELYKAFLPFDNPDPNSPFGEHRFELLVYDGGPAGVHKGVKRQSKAPPEHWTEEEFRPYEEEIMQGADLDYDEWGVMRWVWKAKHNANFLGLPAAGKTTTSRGITVQHYKEGKIVRCSTSWNFRDFAYQLGVVEPPSDWVEMLGVSG